MSADWDDVAIQTLRRMWGAGCTAQRIMEALNTRAGWGMFTRSSVIGKAHRELLDRRPSPIKEASARTIERKMRAASARAKALSAPTPIRAQPAANLQRGRVPNGCAESALTRADSDNLAPRPPSVPHPAARNVPFAELHDRGCKWATTGHQVAVRDARFCNAPRGQHGPYMPYCTRHYDVAVGNGTPSERRADEVPVSQRDLGSVDPWAPAARRVVA